MWAHLGIEHVELGLIALGHQHDRPLVTLVNRLTGGASMQETGAKVSSVSASIQAYYQYKHEHGFISECYNNDCMQMGMTTSIQSATKFAGR